MIILRGRGLSAPTQPLKKGQRFALLLLLYLELHTNNILSPLRKHFRKGATVKRITRLGWKTRSNKWP